MNEDGPATGDRPEWAERIRRERLARHWTQTDAANAMRTFSEKRLPDDLRDQWKRWERGRHKPDETNRILIAAMFGTVVESIFPSRRARLVLPDRSARDEKLLSMSGMDTTEILRRIQSSAVDSSTLTALELTIEQLCCDYAPSDARELIITSRDWLRRITELLGGRLTLGQHREMLTHAGMLALLVGCLEYDIGDKRAAEATRRMAFDLGKEADNSNILGWSYEMQSWFALTEGNYRGAISAAQAGQHMAPGHSVAVQLAAQEAKAWARMGEQRNVVQALEVGRRRMESLPYPDRIDNHFVIDPDKFDFYAMDCYRVAGEDQLAEMSALEVIRKTIDSSGNVLSPMRNSEARITLGVIAARSGDLDKATSHGVAALQNSRQSKPSLRMVGSELDRILTQQHTGAPSKEFHDIFMDATKH